MSDPLTIAASVVGVVVPALHGTRLLLDDVKKIVDAPTIIRHLEDNLCSLENTLASLQAVEESDWQALGKEVAKQLEGTVRSCERACHTIRGDLQRWTRRSQGGKLSWRDRTQIGFFKERQIAAFAQQLQSCKLTCSNVITTATLYSSIRTGHSTQNIENAVTKSQTDITTLSTTTDSRFVEVETALARMTVVDAEQDEEDQDEDHVGAVTQLEEELIALKIIKSLVAELLPRMSKNEIDRTGQGRSSTNVSFGNENKGFQVGISNAAISGVRVGNPP